jgi:hypothetical protein
MEEYHLIIIFYRKTRLITRDDLIIDWRLLYKWAKLIYDNHDKAHGLATLPRFVVFTLNQRKRFLVFSVVLKYPS